jgi:hypothetical protein
MTNFVNRTAEFGTTDPLPKSDRQYQGQTVTDMRLDLIERAKETIKALKKYSNGKFKAPMARSVRNGIAVKIGYGKANVGFFEGPKESRTLVIPILSFPRDQKIVAIAYLQKLITAVQAGEFDELLNDKLTQLSERFSSKKLPNVHVFAAE